MGRLRACVLSVFLSATLGPAVWADTSSGTAPQRQFGWEIFARPDATPPADASDAALATPGLHTLPGLPWSRLYIPASYRPDQPAPLALLLHGSGDSGRTMIEAFADLAEEHGVILLAPDSLQYSWDIMVEGARLRGVKQVPPWGDDVGRIDTALAAAFEEVAVDPSRISLVGFSDGAGYGLSLGANNADLFGNVIAFAPGLLTAVDGEARGRIFLAHGDQDRVLPVGPTRNIFAPALEKLGFAVDLHVFRGRHVMPKALRAQAFAWWLKSPGHNQDRAAQG